MNKLKIALLATCQNQQLTDIQHVSISDHKISIPSSIKKKKGKFLGLFAINNDFPTNLSKAKAYLKRFESFEQNQSTWIVH